MGRKYLLLGAASSLGQEFLQQNHWQDDDEVFAQYCHGEKSLLEIKKCIPVPMKLCPADFLSMASTQQFVDALKERGFLPTHILHMPAIPIVNKRFAETTWDEFEHQIHVQCRSLFFVLHHLMGGMAKARRGKIILVLSSCSIDVPPKFLSSYVMAKYALMGLGKSLASEYASKNIQINMVSPSMMETKFLSHVHRMVIDSAAEKNPMRRNANAKDVVSLIRYLFSDDNSFITGANIPVAGGEVF